MVAGRAATNRQCGSALMFPWVQAALVLSVTLVSGRCDAFLLSSAPPWLLLRQGRQHFSVSRAGQAWSACTVLRRERPARSGWTASARQANNEFGQAAVAGVARPQQALSVGAVLRLVLLGDLSNMLADRAVKCGAISMMTVGQREVYFVAAPVLVKEICVDQAAIFPDRDMLTDDDVSAGYPARLGLTLGQHDAWNRSRSILNPAFFRQDEISDHIQVLVNKTERMCQHWEETTASDTEHSVIDLEQDATALSQSVLLQLLFSHDERLWEHSRVSLARRPRLVRLLEEVMAWSWLLQDQIAALWTADRDFFRFVKAFTNRPGQLAVLRVRAGRVLR